MKDKIMGESLDRHITGNYGEDQVTNDEGTACLTCGCLGDQLDKNGDPCGEISPSPVGCELNEVGECPCCAIINR